jgi:Flp pilus assembly protein TadG
MIGQFLRNVRGNYVVLFAVAMVPIMGGLALAIDFAEMNRQRQATLNALDAAGLATARRIAEGVSDPEALAYANEFFEANLGSVKRRDTTLNVVLPSSGIGGSILKMSATLNYKPYFYPTFLMLLGQKDSGTTIDFSAQSVIRLKNTLEVALVLDNSGSMNELGFGSSKVRFELLKEAAKQLVDAMAAQGTAMKQLTKPVQFGLVPFAASVNVGSQYATASWMDTTGISPVHHENFGWPISLGADKAIKYDKMHIRKVGDGWPAAERGEIVTRLTLLNAIKRYTNSSQTRTAPVFGWDGCVEARSYPYNINDAKPSASSNDFNTIDGDPATLFVPMFAPDEAGEAWTTGSITSMDLNRYNAPNSWWNDYLDGGVPTSRQANMRKYFQIRPFGTTTPSGRGPNYSCTTRPITPLTDVTTSAGLNKVKSALDDMVANGATNVPEGMAWGWRVLSSSEPFTEGRKENERGNDKVVIVLTDGANTYYTPGSLGKGDAAANKSTYAAHAYMSRQRLYTGTSVSQSIYTNANYTKAMNEQFAALCDNAKGSSLVVMTVALDLSMADPAEKAQIDALEKCSSDSRFRKDAEGKPEKLFWNTTGGNLEETFKKIADELSNLRIVG